MRQIRRNREAFAREAEEFARLVGKGQTVLVTTHVSPDGDAVASTLAAAEIVKLIGGRPVCGLEAAVPRRFGFLPGASEILQPEALPDPDYLAVLIVDCGNLARIGKNTTQRLAAEADVVNIDHHADNQFFGKLNLVQPLASSTTEILFDLIQALKLPLAAPLATLLYAGLLTDTGGFRHTNTTAQTFSKAASLAAAGSDPAKISADIYSANSLASVKLLGQALQSLELFADGRVAMMTIPDLPEVEEPENLADSGLGVQGVELTALFRLGAGTCRVSLRARGDYDVAKIARTFGGGGHPKAAGFTYSGSAEAIRARVLEALREEMEDSTARYSPSS